jgi:transposase
MKAPKRIELNPEQMKEFLKRVEDHSLKDDDYETIKGMAQTIAFLINAVQQKKGSIGRLLRMLFGAPTEKLKNVFKHNDDEDPKGGTPASKGDTQPRLHKRKGHGKNAAHQYSAAKKITVSFPSLSPGDKCLECQKGKVYEMTQLGTIVRFTGGAPLQATVYEIQKLRCNLCGQIYKPDVKADKYDETARAMIPLLKYGSGLPFYRLKRLQENLGFPLPASTQWDVVKGTSNRIEPVYTELIHQAAQGQIIHNDDTTMKILTQIKDNETRKGMFTTGILSVLKEGAKVALFLTGKNHSGENMEYLLRKRHKGLSPPIQMCDALSRNIPKSFHTILANCLAHGRRKFVEIIDSFPEESHYVIHILAQVYHNDEVAQNMSSTKRLQFHQEKSGPLMQGLKSWFETQIDDKKVEPNSCMGNAISYMLNHWDALTLFLRVEKAPLDNNICEQALKMTIQHRKNSLFYKTTNGAYVGDLFMSIIHTCRLNKVNPFDYLIALQKHSSEVIKNPHAWMPWNYQSMPPPVPP